MGKVYFVILSWMLLLLVCNLAPNKINKAMMLIVLLGMLSYLSSQDGICSERMSDSLAGFLRADNALVVRKIFGHILPNMAVGFLAFWIFCDVPQDGIRIIMPLIVCLTWANLDEFHQSFVSERYASYTDVMINFCSNIFGMILFQVNRTIGRRSKLLK